MSKLTCNGVERRVTRQMTAIQLETRNPLRIPEMLENILGFLPVEELKTCRLVNKFWKESAFKPMKQKCGDIEFGRNHPYKRGLEDMEKFLRCFSADPGSGLLSEVRDNIPCTKFEISTTIINEQNNDRDKLIVANFFQAISPWVTEMTLQGGKDFGNVLNGIEESLFPSLKCVVFADRYITLGTPCAFSPWMSVFIQNSPQLEKISFWSLSGLYSWPFQDTSLQQFLQALAQNCDRNIKTLDICANREQGFDLVERI